MLVLPLLLFRPTAACVHLRTLGICLAAGGTLAFTHARTFSRTLAHARSFALTRRLRLKGVY